MKSTEQITNDGKYGSVQSQHELSRQHKNDRDGHKNSEYNASILVKPATGHRTINAKKSSLDCEQNKWIPSLGGQHTISPRNFGEIAAQKKPKDWLVSARNYHAKTEPTKDSGLATAMSIATIKLLNQTNLNIENVSNPQRNHSSDLKASATAFISTNPANSCIDRPRIEQKQILPVTNASVEKCNAGTDLNRSNKQISSFNGNDEHSTDNTESSHKSIINNHPTIVNSSSSKLNDSSSKTKKPTPSERKYKSKSDPKAEKRKHTNSGKNATNGTDGGGISARKCTSNQIHHESLQRLPLRTHENDTCANGKQRLDKEWHSPESYIYDDISSDAAAAKRADHTSCMQTFWFRDIPNENLLTREQRLENKRDNLRRQAFQYAQAQHFRSTILAKRRLITVTKALAKFKNERNKYVYTEISIVLKILLPNWISPTKKVFTKMKYE